MEPHVSRETLLRSYGDLLWEANRETNLVSRQLDRAGLQALIDGFALTLEAAGVEEPGGRLLDVGSGGGLPGVPLAIWHPRVQVFLSEERRRRTEILERLVEALGLPNVEVLGGNVRRAARAEPLAGGVDTCTAFGVGPATEVIDLVLPLLAPGGTALLSIPSDPSPAEEGMWVLQVAQAGARAEVRRHALVGGRSILVLTLDEA